MLKYKNFYIPLIVSFFLIVFIQESFYFKTSSVLNSVEFKDELNFYIASDIHYLSPELTDYGKAFDKFISSGDGKQINYISEILDAFTYDIKNNSPDFVIISGDLTVNGELKSHTDLSAKLKSIKDLGTNVYVIPGNHDINNPYARSFINGNQIKVDSISPKEFKNIYNDFGFNEALSKDSSSLSYLVAPSSNLWLLMLDSNLYNNNLTINSPEVSGAISQPTLKWIEECSALAKENNARIIAVSHHNLLNHSEFVNSGYTLNNSTELIEAFSNLDINLMFSGHTHIQSIKNTEINNSTIYDICNTSLATFPQRFGVAKYSENSLDYSTKELNINYWAKSTDTKDSILLNFKEYSKSFFKALVFNNLIKNISTDDSLKTEDIEALASTVLNIRLKYDYKLNHISWSQICSSPEFELLKKHPSIFLKHYVNIALEGNEDANRSIIIDF